MTDLSEILDRGVPEPPALEGLALRAETGARRRRVRRRAGLVAVAVAVVVAAAVAIPRSEPERDDDRVAVERPSEVAACGGATAVREGRLLPSHGVAYARFCPTGAPRSAVVPDTVLTDGLADLVDGLNESMTASQMAFCIARDASYEVQVGYADGTVYSYDEATACSGALRRLMTAIATAESVGLAPMEPPPLTCSTPSTAEVADIDALAASALTRLPAVAAIACSGSAEAIGYDSPVEVEDPEAKRLELLSVRYRPVPEGCGVPDPNVRFAVVLVVADGSIHRFDDPGACEPVSIDGVAVGDHSLLEGVDSPHVYF